VKYHRDDNGMINDYHTILDYTNESRLPAYFRIDVAASYGLSFGKSGEVEMGMSIHNITDHRNIKTRKLDTSGLDEAIFTNTELPANYIDVVLLGFMPTLFVNVSF
jgi:ferric enterobactin receptor